MSHDTNRRSFFKNSAVFAAGIAAGSATRVLGANDRITVGVIGAGRQGVGVQRTFARQENVEIAAICDVFEENLGKGIKAAGDKTPASYKDFRQLLERKDMDAVIIGSPDHWHALHSVMACQAGKDVYVEKPLSLTVSEGRKMVEAARKYNRVVQVGTQQRSGPHFQKAVELIWHGQIGKITFVRTWNYGNQYPKGFGNPPDSEPPAGLDWDMWLGPAPLRPFNASRFGVAPNRFSTFRFFWDYAGGMMTDWGVHLLDIVLWALKADGPSVITASGSKFLLTDNRETPDTLQVTYEFPGCVVTYENRECNGNSMYGKGYGIEFHGTEGTLFVDRAGFQLHPEKRRIGEKEYDLTASAEMKDLPNSGVNHAVNFLECMKTRQRPICDVEIGHRSTTTCLLANIAYRTKERLEWDPKAERLIRASKQAEQLLQHNYRKPWVLTV
jgi:predicted dehydrogenase